jgi:hypothetical protein
MRELVDAGPMAPGIPVPLGKVNEALNPSHLPVYAGPTGEVAGIVKISGDASPNKNITVPFECGEAYATYSKVFREGPGRALADALVAVTGYAGYVPPSGEVRAVSIHGCAFDTRTMVLTYGQHIEVSNRDPRESFLPQLLGARSPALLVAVPHGDAVKLYPTEVGHYALADGMNHTWMYADVFVVRYPTSTVTGLDGRFRISGIPVGKVKVSAYLPAIDASIHADEGIAKPDVDREVEVKAGETTQVDLVIAYKVPKLRPKPTPPVPLGPDIR